MRDKNGKTLTIAVPPDTISVIIQIILRWVKGYFSWGKVKSQQPTGTVLRYDITKLHGLRYIFLI